MVMNMLNHKICNGKIDRSVCKPFIGKNQFNYYNLIF